MTPQRSGRGRPKGTGLDDSDTIAAITGLIAANPDMKPTTAIKELGISDPSVIRRLRDKYQASLQAFASCESSTPPSRTMAAARKRDPKLTQAIQARSVDATARVAEGRTADERSDRPSQDSFEQSLARMVGIGIGVFVSGVEAQASLLAYGLKNAPVGPFFQTQVMFTEAALQFAADLITVQNQLS